MNGIPPPAFGMPGSLEWLVIGLVALLLFGKRLPGVARSLGQALHEFRSGLSGPEAEKPAAPGPEAKPPEKPAA